MCGIAGIKRNGPGADENLLHAMRDTFVYRGPDDQGSWFDQAEGVALGHRRLSIIDPTPSGHQPMVDQDNGNVIVFNGEVFNYLEIREELSQRGCSFHTGTDTEVILQAYNTYGEDCVSHFNGMFAIAIWDKEKQQLFIARDRLGIKPFYYHQNAQGDFVFASEVKAIRKALPEACDLEVELIDTFMNFGYIPGEKTLEKGILRLLPGHKGVLKNGNLTISKYWDIAFNNKEDKGFEYYLEESRRLLNNAIDLRLRSDVPLGIFLSGGIDSSAVVGLLAQRTTERLKTFSVAYDFGKEYNETYYAQMVAKKFNTDHHELFITAEQFKKFIPTFSHLMDEPVTESAAISLQFISQMAKDHVTVVLSGEGSDEIFGGYDLYRYMQVIEKYRTNLGGTITGALGEIANTFLPKQSKLAKYARLSSQTLEQRYKGISTYDSYYKTRLYKEEFKTLTDKSCGQQMDQFLQELFSHTKGKDPLSRMLYFDTKTWLVDDLLIKADRMSMAASLELRVPFLDYRLVEFASSIPSKYKIYNGEGKYILKKMMEGILPNEIIYRKKMGFPTPLKRMFQGDLATYARDTLASSSTQITEYFDKQEITRILDEHIGGKTDHHRILWQLIVLEEWFLARKSSS